MKNLFLALITVLCFSTEDIQAQPGNDDCADAINLTSGTICNYTSGTTVNATQSIPAIACPFTQSADDDVWYQFTAVTTTHTVNVQCGVNFDGVVDIRSGSCNGSNIACSDKGGSWNLETVQLNGLTVGLAYYIRIYSAGFMSGDEGSFQICVIHSCVLPSKPGSISGNTSVCQNSADTYSVTPASGATSYIWTLPSGWTGSSSTNSISATASATSGNITVKAKNACGSSAAQILPVTVNLIPSQPGSISGNTSVCQNSTNTYSVAIVSGATSGTWTLPSGWTGSSSTNSITATASASSGNITVMANNACGSSAEQILPVTVNLIPSQPGNISGNTSVCQNSTNTYSVAIVSGATSGTWTLPSGWTGSSSTNSITATASASSGNITVMANNSCGSSAAQTLAITVNPLPGNPGAITGNTNSQISNNNPYSISPMAGAIGYIWTVTSGGTIASGQNTANILVNWTTQGTHSVCVTATYACGTSAPQCAAITVSSSTGIINYAEDFTITILPNPSSGQFTIQTSNAILNADISVTNILGEKIFSSTVQQLNNSTIDLPEQTNGIYFIRIKSKNRSTIQKLIIQK